MSLYESGYLQEGNKFTLRGKNYGTISLIDNVLVFNGKKGRNIRIPITDIENVSHSGVKVILTLKGRKVWSFAINPYWRSSKLIEIIENKRKAEAMDNLLKYLIKKGKENR